MHPLIRVILTGCLLATLPAHAQDIRTGLWDISLSMTADSSPQDFGPFNKTQCFHENDVRDPARLLGEIGADCTYGNRQYHGNQFSFTIQCDGALPLRGSGSVQYDADHFDGTLRLNAAVPGGGHVETHSHVRGKRIGDC